VSSYLAISPQRGIQKVCRPGSIHAGVELGEANYMTSAMSCGTDHYRGFWLAEVLYVVVSLMLVTAEPNRGIIGQVFELHGWWVFWGTWAVRVC
jgi:hypothetical protein